MAQVLFAADTTPSLVDLDANFTSQYSWRELLTTPDHGTFGSYTGANVKYVVDSSFNFHPNTDASLSLGLSTKRWTIVYAGGLSDGADSLLTTSGTGVRVGAGASWTSTSFWVSGAQVGSVSSSGLLMTSTAPLGYGTGSGGSVTQATSRTTGVTLNKTNGAITLVSAAGTATWQSFTVTNSTVAATDVVRVVQKSGTDLNMIHVTAVGAGSFRISFATTGGTTTEQPVFNFAVLKAVTA